MEQETLDRAGFEELMDGAIPPHTAATAFTEHTDPLP
jgi:hypothetical protein